MPYHQFRNMSDGQGMLAVQALIMDSATDESAGSVLPREASLMAAASARGAAAPAATTAGLKPVQAALVGRAVGA